MWINAPICAARTIVGVMVGVGLGPSVGGIGEGGGVAVGAGTPEFEGQQIIACASAARSANKIDAALWELNSPDHGAAPAAGIFVARHLYAIRPEKPQSRIDLAKNHSHADRHDLPGLTRESI